MAIAHICTGCGLDLARHRPARDPHHGMLIVTCTRCGRAAARRRHPMQRAWRTALRVKTSLLLLLLQAAALAFLTVMTIPLAHSLAYHASRHASLAELWADEKPLLIVVFIMVPVATGVWLGAAFRHWRHGMQWLAWAVWIFTLGWVIPPVVSAIEGGAWPPSGNPLDVKSGVSTLALAAFGAMWGLSWAGLPMARLLSRAADLHRRSRWSRRRRRRRMNLQGGAG